MKRSLVLIAVLLIANLLLGVSEHFVSVSRAQEPAALEHFTHCQSVKVLSKGIDINEGWYVMGFGFGGAQGVSSGYALICRR